jgi:hypothetical protein
MEKGRETRKFKYKNLIQYSSRGSCERKDNGQSVRRRAGLDEVVQIGEKTLNKESHRVSLEIRPKLPLTSQTSG